MPHVCIGWDLPSSVEVPPFLPFNPLTLNHHYSARLSDFQRKAVGEEFVLYVGPR